MFTWALVNVILGLLALLFIGINSSAPHRLRFQAGFAALVAWLVPWQFLPAFMPGLPDFGLANVEREFVANNRFAGVDVLFIETRSLPLSGGTFSLSFVEGLLVAFFVIGAALFMWNVAAHRARLQHLSRTGRDGSALWQWAGMHDESTQRVPVTI